MKKQKTIKTNKKNRIRNGSLAFDIFNYIFLGSAAALCLLPILNVLAISFSSSAKASAGLVKLIPLDFNIESYKYALAKPQFLSSFLISVKRVILGYVINIVCTILTAYPLSKSSKELKGRNIYAWFMFITTIFSGGMIPTFMVINQLGLMNTLWALILPGAVPVFNVILMMNFFKQIPGEITESAIMDGAGHVTVLCKLFLPLSKPSLATISLFTVVGHWNEWFSGMLYMRETENYPLQTYLQSIIVVRDASTLASATKETLEMLSKVSDRTLKSAQIFIAAAPILLVYPFVQKYFMKGLTVGSVKG